MSPLSQLVRRVSTSDAIGRALRLVARRESTVLTYHRLSGIAGTRPEVLRAALAYLRRHRYPVRPLGALLDDAAAGRARSAVAFTFDDGYADFAEVAQPIFAEFDCPVTVFVSTGPVDRQCWFWWDAVEYGMTHARTRRAVVADGDVRLDVAWQSDAERHVRYLEVCEALKRVSTPVRERLGSAFVEALGVTLPALPPAEYAMMTWDDVRRCERAGVTIGGHTVTHPILARCDDARSRWELEESVRRLRAECAGPIDVFAYPNGRPDVDFGDREVAVLRAAGVRWAVSTEHAHVVPEPSRYTSPDARFRVPRVSDPGGLPAIVRVVSGVDRWRRPA
jgi:peptidoglycan/xylan/chitin deacetylase (PgdA/CDA1 family)